MTIIWKEKRQATLKNVENIHVIIVIRLSSDFNSGKKNKPLKPFSPRYPPHHHSCVCLSSMGESLVAHSCCSSFALTVDERERRSVLAVFSRGPMSKLILTFVCDQCNATCIMWPSWCDARTRCPLLTLLSMMPKTLFRELFFLHKGLI